MARFIICYDRNDRKYFVIQKSNGVPKDSAWTMGDAIKKKRWLIKERKRSRKLTEADKLRIVIDHEKGSRVVDLARQYCVSRITIHNIIKLHKTKGSE